VRDVHGSVIVLYYKLFYYLEHHDLLDSLNELHLWALQFVYIPRINRSLKEFISSWNNHPIRTACHKTPQQLFTAGILILQNSNIEALDFSAVVDENYGVDPDIVSTADDNLGVIVAESTVKFSDANKQALRSTIDPLGVTDNYGIDIYEQTLQLISTFNQSQH